MSMMSMNESGDDLLTLDEAAAMLKCSRGKIYGLGRKGKLDLVKFDHLTRVTRDSVIQLLREIKNTPREIKKREA